MPPKPLSGARRATYFVCVILKSVAKELTAAGKYLASVVRQHMALEPSHGPERLETISAHQQSDHGIRQIILCIERACQEGWLVIIEI
jgi:hypothetical protein